MTGLVTREVHDDPWILYRYAENLAAGHGWTFNPGQPTENAVTSVLTVLLLAAALAIKIPIFVTSTALYIAGTWAAASFTYLTLRNVGHAVGGAAAGFLVVLAPPLISLRGMETALYLGLIAAAFYAVEGRRRLVAGILLGLAIMARPDAAVVAAAVVAWLVVWERAVPWRIGIGSCLVLLPWLAVTVPLTGSVLPSTLAAKVAQADSGYWQGFLYGTFFFPAQKSMALWFLLALPLGAIGVVAAVRWRLTPLVPLVLGTLGQAVAYGLVLEVASYAWYVALPVFLLAWLAGCGAERLVMARSTSTCRVAVGSGLLAAAVVSATLTPSMLPIRQEHVAVSEWLATNTAADATVAAAEIGRIGSFSDRTMVDYLGLLDRRAVPHVAQADWDWWVQELRPDYWVADGNAEFTPDAAVKSNPAFNAAYLPVMATEHLTVYQRR